MRADKLCFDGDGPAEAIDPHLNFNYTREARSGLQVIATAPGVPEPATWAMMLVGVGGLGAVMRSRRRTAPQAA